MTANLNKSSQKTGKLKSFRIDSVENPLYTLSRKYDAPLTYVEDFTNSTSNLMAGHLQGKDLTIAILKEIVQRHNTKAPVGLVKLKDTLKESATNEKT